MADYLNGRCCIFQPFDSDGPYDKRFDDVIVPAVTAIDLEPYRVDKDYGSAIPIDTLHAKSKALGSVSLTSHPQIRTLCMSLDLRLLVAGM